MHPLEEIIQNAGPVLLIGDSAANRFPAMSFHAYQTMSRTVYCVDLGGLQSSRGFSSGLPVLNRIEDVPADWGGDLAVIWVHPAQAASCVKMAAQAGCRRVWLSFGTYHPAAIEIARELNLEVVEAGRCPIWYTNGPKPAMCKFHTAMGRLSGAWAKSPQTEISDTRRELI